MLARRVQFPLAMVSSAASPVTAYSEQTIAIANIIERYLNDHPRAADTPEGIRDWWVARQRYIDSVTEVQNALDYLVASGRLSRCTLADGTTVYARAPAHN
jgi:hypothetical protein